jgi:hypothetical protein
MSQYVLSHYLHALPIPCLHSSGVSDDELFFSHPERDERRFDNRSQCSPAKTKEIRYNGDFIKVML